MRSFEDKIFSLFSKSAENVLDSNYRDRVSMKEILRMRSFAGVQNDGEKCQDDKRENRMTKEKYRNDGEKEY